MPLQADGMRIDPPWSPPMAMSTSCKATSTALPLEEPPALRVRSHGFFTAPVAEVKLAPEKHKSSQTDLPTTVAPAANKRLTTVASSDGT